jgi:hypothetical protein
MEIRNFFPEFKDEGEIIAAFGQAKLASQPRPATSWTKSRP